jgi:hypothetical protein
MRPGAVQAFVAWSRDHRLLPEAWLYGLSFVEINARGRSAYFAGEYRLTGWRGFFPAIFLLKTSLPALALIVVGFLGLASVPACQRSTYLYRTSPLLVLLAVYWIFSLQSHLNIGHRHLLPIYPAFYIIAGGAFLLVRRQASVSILLLVLVALHGRESIAIRPDYLAYFNPLCGGPEKAYRIFVDSSLDWGQDLPRLGRWLREHAPEERVYLSYFGKGSPKQEGIKAIRIGDPFSSEAIVSSFKGGIYCVSATMFSRVYASVRGVWTLENENAYQQLSVWFRHLRMQHPGNVLDDADTSARLDYYESLRFSRLCHFLQLRPPDARIGYSILIFRLSDEEASLVTDAPLPVLNARILRSQP